MEDLIKFEENENPNINNPLLKDGEYSGYFKSREHEIAYYFKLNNVLFDEFLGIKKIHMVDVKKAKDLRNAYLRIFHSDRKVKAETDLNYDEVCADIKVTFHRVSGGKL